MTLHATCPTNGTEIDFGFPVFASGEPTEIMPRGCARAVRLDSGDIQVEVTDCPACGRVHNFLTPAEQP
jgi:hypothetical protein